MGVYLVRHRGALDVEGRIATHSLVGDWGDVTDETLVETTPEGARRIKGLQQVLHIDAAPAGLYVGDAQGAVVIDIGGRWQRLTESEMTGYDPESHDSHSAL